MQARPNVRLCHGGVVVCEHLTVDASEVNSHAPRVVGFGNRQTGGAVARPRAWGDGTKSTHLFSAVLYDCHQFHRVTVVLDTDGGIITEVNRDEVRCAVCVGHRVQGAVSVWHKDRLALVDGSFDDVFVFGQIRPRIVVKAELSPHRLLRGSAFSVVCSCHLGGGHGQTQEAVGESSGAVIEAGGKRSGGWKLTLAPLGGSSVSGQG